MFGTTGIEILGRSAWSREVRALVERVAPTMDEVLIVGASGTGRRHLARAIHASGPRASQPFICVACSLLGGELLASQLFGHLPGAFLGMRASSLGALRAARHGTVFLSDVDELTLDDQEDLAGAIRRRSLTPLGGIESIGFSARVIASVSRDVDAALRDGRLAAPLYENIDKVRVYSPSLRQRLDDLEPLARHFFAQAQQTNPLAARLTRSALTWLRTYSWPGNVAELESLMSRAAQASVLAARPADCELLRRLIVQPPAAAKLSPPPADGHHRALQSPSDLPRCRGAEPNCRD